MLSIAEYKAHWDLREAARFSQNEKRRANALKMSKELEEILVMEFRVKKVVLFGSVLEPGRFREDSDIDIAVEGLAKRDHFKALARLMMKSPVEVDLKPIEDVSELLRQRIAKGKVLYAEREDS